MAATQAADFPIVGRRSPEILRLVQTLRSWLPSTSEPPPARSGDRRTPEPFHQGSYATNVHVRAADLDLDIVVVVNALGKEGSMAPSTVTKLVQTARAQQPGRNVIVVLDEESPEAVRAARVAGACEFLGRDEIDNEEAVYWRFRNAALLSRAAPVLEKNPTTPRPLTVRKSARLSEPALREADAAVDAAVAALPTAEERRGRGTDLLEIVAPELRDPGSGRLDARRIAAAIGLSLAALARASGVSQQALSATPDSPGAQAGLLPIARLSEMLDEMFSPEHRRVWMQTPHSRFGGRSPAQAIEAGDAELVALSVESALEGHPD